MAKHGVNRVILIGNLGNNPESRVFPDGTTVTNVSVATSESWQDKNTGEKKEAVEWNRVVLRDRGAFKLGEIAATYLKKGSKVYIEGSLRTRKWQDNTGNDRYTTEIIAAEMQMLDPPPQQGQQPARQAPQAAPRQQAAPQAYDSRQPAYDPAPQFDDESIPF